MFGHKHYVPVMKGKRAEFSVLGQFVGSEAITPLIEAIPSQPPSTAPRALENNGWPANKRYFLDLLFLDDENAAVDAPIDSVSTALTEASQRSQNFVPVTGTGRSPGFQAAIAGNRPNGVAIRLVPDDFEDEEELENALVAILQLFSIEPSDVDLIVDMGSVAGQVAAVLTQISRANLEVIPDIDRWRTITLISGAFPMGLAELTRDVWSFLPRTDWQAWQMLAAGRRRPSRLPSYGDYGIANTNLPPEGRATILAQLRYSTPTDFMIWKGRNAIKEGFGQFFNICQNLVARPEYRGLTFSPGDQEIYEKATIGGSPGSAETWRKIGTSHHFGTVLDQIASLP
jgi:hypothetical protein